MLPCIVSSKYFRIILEPVAPSFIYKNYSVFTIIVGRKQIKTFKLIELKKSPSNINLGTQE